MANDSEEYYSYDDEYSYYDSDEPAGGAKSPPGLPVAKPASRRMQPPVRAPAPAPTRGVSPSLPAQPRPMASPGFRPPSNRRSANKVEEDDYSYYDYDDEEDGGKYSYDYEYEEEYNYDYEYEYEEYYDDEEDDTAVPIARPKNPMMAMLDPAALASAKRNMNHNEENFENRKAPVAVDRPFGLTSTKIKNLKSGMRPVSKKNTRGAVNQQDFRSNLNGGGGGGARANRDLIARAAPAWANPSLKKGARPMTTNVQKVDVNRIRAEVEKAKQLQRAKGPAGGPKFLNGVPTGRTSVRRVRVKDQRGSARLPPTGARVSAKITVNRQVDPNNPNKFISKQRVSYKVRKEGTKRVSARFDPNKARVSARKAGGGGGKSRRISKNGGGAGRTSTRAKSRRVSKNANGELRKSRNGKSRRISKNSENGRTSTRKSKRVSSRKVRKDGGGGGMPGIERMSVRKRKKKPNVSAMSVNFSMLGAKTAAAGGEGVGNGDGCYLKFDSTQGGTLFAQFSAVGYDSSEALAFFKPKTPVPRFKYRRNDGRENLVSGTSNDFSRLAEGWTYFWTMAFELDGEIHILGQSDKREFEIDFIGLDSKSMVREIDQKRAINSKGWTCIACVPKDCESFDDMDKVDPNKFMTVAKQEGDAVRLA